MNKMIFISLLIGSVQCMNGSNERETFTITEHSHNRIELQGKIYGSNIILTKTPNPVYKDSFKKYGYESIDVITLVYNIGDLIEASLCKQYGIDKLHVDVSNDWFEQGDTTAEDIIKKSGICAMKYKND